MEIENIQKQNRFNEKWTKVILSVIKFLIRPLILMFIFWLVISLPFSVNPLNYIQAFILQIFINIIERYDN